VISDLIFGFFGIKGNKKFASSGILLKCCASVIFCERKEGRKKKN